MLTSKGLGPYGAEGFLAEGSGRHTEQDEAGHDDGGYDSSGTTVLLRHDDNSGLQTDTLNTSDA